MKPNSAQPCVQQEFTIEDDQFGEKKIVELKQGGSKIPVTEENKDEYARLVVSYRLDHSIEEQIKAFLDGFYGFAFLHVAGVCELTNPRIVPRHLIQIFEPDQLECKRNQRI